MRKNIWLFLALLFLFIFNHLIVKSQIYYWENESKGISFTIDLPESSPPIIGIFFMLFSGEYDSGEVIENWDEYDEIKDICNMNRLAFLGARINNCEIKEEFDDAMDYFATVSQHSELRHVPLILDGLSGGVNYATCFAYTQFQNRTIAYIAHCGWGNFNDAEPDDILKIPALWITGGLNADGMLPVVREIFYRYRPDGALWTLAIVPGMGHRRSDNEFLRPYIDTLIKMRIDPGSETLREITGDKYWLGNNDMYYFVPYNDYNDNIDSSSWLPSLDFALTWQAYLSNNPLLEPFYASGNNLRYSVSYNESKKTIVIRNHYLASEIKVTLTNVNGRILFYSALNIHENENSEIRIKDISSGLYYVNIITNGFNKTFPVAIY